MNRDLSYRKYNADHKNSTVTLVISESPDDLVFDQ